MFKKLSVRSQLLGMLVGIVALLVAFAIVVWIAASAISGAANDMGRGKDVVADIQTPPLTVVEAEVAMLQILQGSDSEATVMIAKLSELKDDYDFRNSFWEKESLDPQVKEALLGEQKKEADEFWRIVMGDFVKAIEQGDRERAKQLAEEANLHYANHRNNVVGTINLAVKYAEDKFKSLNSTSASVRWLVLALAGGGGLLAAGTMAMVVREIMRRLGGEPLEMQVAARRIADGDLTVRVAVKPGDQVSLLYSIMQMQSNLRDTITQSLTAATQLADAVASLAASSQEVSKSSVQQSEAAASMAVSVDEVTASIGHVSESANSAFSLAEETGALSTEGKVLVQNTIGEMNEIAESVHSSNELIQSLGEQSSQISNIVNVIKEIADQTNLLALNAAIEAARAGEQGRGFAVVADEVRKLAERTTASTQEIASMIDAIQKGTHRAAEGMEQGSQKVAGGVQMAAKTGESMLRIEQGAKNVQGAVEDISSALREQSASSVQIAKNVERIAQMAKANSASLDEVARATSHLGQLAASLKTSVDKFKV